MKSDDSSIHYSAPDTSPVVLLVVDMFADYESPDTEALYRPALQVAKRLQKLREKTRRANIPTIFVNDNYGRWHSSGWSDATQALQSRRGNLISDLLNPQPSDYFVLKPKHSAFFATPLNVLLRYLKASTLILTGSSGTQCILYSAIEAYIRDYSFCIPLDCVVCEDPKERRIAKYLFEKRLHADVRSSDRLPLGRLSRHAKRH